jgi:hypothetical protein
MREHSIRQTAGLKALAGYYRWIRTDRLSEETIHDLLSKVGRKCQPVGRVTEGTWLGEDRIESAGICTKSVVILANWYFDVY